MGETEGKGHCFAANVDLSWCQMGESSPPQRIEGMGSMYHIIGFHSWDGKGRLTSSLGAHSPSLDIPSIAGKTYTAIPCSSNHKMLLSLESMSK